MTSPYMNALVNALKVYVRRQRYSKPSFVRRVAAFNPSYTVALLETDRTCDIWGDIELYLLNSGWKTVWFMNVTLSFRPRSRRSGVDPILVADLMNTIMPVLLKSASAQYWRFSRAYIDPNYEPLLLVLEFYNKDDPSNVCRVEFAIAPRNID